MTIPRLKENGRNQMAINHHSTDSNRDNDNSGNDRSVFKMAMMIRRGDNHKRRTSAESSGDSNDINVDCSTGSSE